MKALKRAGQLAAFTGLGAGILVATNSDHLRPLRVIHCSVASLIDYKLNVDADDASKREEKYEWKRRELSEREAEQVNGWRKRTAERMLWVAKENGGVFVKLGQFIASMKPAVPAEFSTVLSALLNDAQKDSFDEVRSVVERELGAPLSTLFSRFDEQPVGSASIAQVHKAVLADGVTEVAVKVQHGNVARRSLGDLQLLKWITSCVEFVAPDQQYGWIFPEFENAMAAELDFENEGANSEVCGQLFAGDTRVAVPRVFWDLTTKRVLTMEFINGVPINDVEGIKRLVPRDSLRSVASAVLDVFSAMTFEHGWLHADPHPGNILVRENPKHPGKSQIVLLDHGLYRVIGEKFRLSYCGLWKALVLFDKAGVIEHATALAPTPELGKIYAHILSLVLTYRSPTGVDGTASPKVKLGEAEYDYLDDDQVEERRNKFTVKGKDGKEGRPGFGYLLSFLEGLPRDLLFVFRVNNLVRSLNYELGGTSAERLRKYGVYAIRGLYARRTPENEYAHKYLLPLKVRGSVRAAELEGAMEGRAGPSRLSYLFDLLRVTWHLYVFEMITDALSFIGFGRKSSANVKRNDRTWGQG